MSGLGGSWPTCRGWERGFGPGPIVAARGEGPGRAQIKARGCVPAEPKCQGSGPGFLPGPNANAGLAGQVWAEMSRPWYSFGYLCERSLVCHGSLKTGVQIRALRTDTISEPKLHQN